MTEEQADDTRIMRGMMWGFILSIPVYAIIGLVGYGVWRLIAWLL